MMNMRVHQEVVVGQEADFHCNGVHITCKMISWQVIAVRLV